MRQSFGLIQTQTQKQVLAPRMIQSMEILQLPVMALQERIEQELIENPILEAHEEAGSDSRTDTESPDAKTTEEKELVVDEQTNNSDDFERLLEMDREYPDQFNDAPRRSASEIFEAGERKLDAMANVESRDTTLHAHLEAQLGELDLPHELREMAERIISSLDSNGYLTGSLEDILPPMADPSALHMAEKALEIVQQLDPPGVGARDLRECLLLQLTPDLLMYEELCVLISDHLDDLQHNRLPTIEKKTGLTLEHIQEALVDMRTLNPKPGTIFSDVAAPTVTPDLFVDQMEDGSYRVRMEEGRTPSLRINRYYRDRFLSGQATAEEKEFIKRKINAAQWLIESIEQRRNTLNRVAQAIIDHQRRFLDEGPEAIEPLKMQQIADKVGVHVTTVSRAVGDKWVQTPRGIYPLKRFFAGGTKSTDGEDVTWDAIRIKLQELIDNEDKSKPYSDDELVKRLKESGFSAARRTITKYRKKMGIPSSRQRKDWSMAKTNKKEPV